MSSDAKIILIWLAILFFTCVTIYALWWSLFWDRSRGQRRCPKCWHSILDRFPFRCSECGYFTLFEKNIFRTRRRFGFATITLVALLTATFWLRDQVSTLSWYTLFPDRIIIALLPMANDGEALYDIGPYLAKQLARGEMSDANVARLLDQCTRGDDWAPPGSDHWLRKYSSIADFMLSTSEIASPPIKSKESEYFRSKMMYLTQGLNSMPPFIRLDTPEIWNALEPVVVSANIRLWWPQESHITLRVDSVEGLGLTDATLARLKNETWVRVNPSTSNNSMFTIDLGMLAPGKHSGKLFVTWKSELPISPPEQILCSEGVIEIPVAIDVLPQGQSLTAITTPEIDELVEQAFAPGLLRWSTGEVRHAFSYRPYSTSSSELDSVAFGLIVEALEDGVPRRMLKVWWRGGRGGVRAGWQVLFEDQEALDRAAQNSHWTMRVRGDEALARRAGALYSGAPVTQWWSGSIEFPLVVNQEPSEPSGRVWRLKNNSNTAALPHQNK